MKKSRQFVKQSHLLVVSAGSTGQKELAALGTRMNIVRKRSGKRSRALAEFH